jgi:hypothetical protein
MHHTCIKNYDLKRMNPKKQYVYSLKEGEDGRLHIERKGTQRTVMQWPDDGMDAQRIGVRRF